jgi:hypothetical protein
VNSRCTDSFWKLFADLPEPVRQQAARKYRLWRRDPGHPSLRFKQVHASRPIWSVRIARDYRTLGLRGEDGMVWFWIGSHADYDRLLR